MSTQIRTFTGKLFNPYHPKPELICIKDIAHSLSHICRFTGHVKEMISVAQHSVYVSMLADEGDQLVGLLHDASEAYLTDVSHPVKHNWRMYWYRRAERKLQNAIYLRLEGREYEPLERFAPSVHGADQYSLEIERSAFQEGNKFKLLALGPELIRSWSPAEAEARFLERYEYLVKHEVSRAHKEGRPFFYNGLWYKVKKNA